MDYFRFRKCRGNGNFAMKMLNFGAIYKGYNRKAFLHDLSGGLIVGVVALPLAISFCVAAGLSAVDGIYATVIASIVMAAYGGMQVQIAGPTGACVLIVYGIVSKFGTQGLVIATCLAGLMLVAMGVLRMGRLIRLIPDPLIEGFTAGIAIDLFVSELRDFGGLDIVKLPVGFPEKILAYFQHFSTFNYFSLGIGLLTILINYFSPLLVSRRFPGAIVAIIVPSLIVFFLHLPVRVVGVQLGGLLPSLPVMNPHAMSIHTVVGLLRPAFGIAVLVSIMSLVSGSVAESVTGFRLRSNKELVAEGVANMFSGLVGGIPVTGSIARTMTSVENGGRTPVAGLVQSVVLLILLFFFGGWIQYIPVASVAGLLMVVAYNMSKWRRVTAILFSWSGDTVLMLATFAITLFINLTVAIEVGFLLATIQFMGKMSRISNVREITTHFDDDQPQQVVQTESYRVPHGVAVYEITGPLFFGAAYKFKESFFRHKEKPDVFIVRMGNVPIVDSTGVRTILKVAASLKAQHVHLVISEFDPGIADSKLYDLFVSRIGVANVVATFAEALVRSEDLVNMRKKGWRA